MSEYQYVAIDGPVSDDNLKFMHKQSSRAEISAWRFTNEYNFSSFHGRADEMLRRGYGMHLHFANFGIRKLSFRLPELPCDKKLLHQFLPKVGVERHQKVPGPNGTAEADCF